MKFIRKKGILIIELFTLFLLSYTSSNQQEISLHNNNNSDTDNIKVFNLTSSSNQAGALIGMINDKHESASSSSPYYIVPIVPETTELLNKYLLVDSDSGKITINTKIELNLIKFSALSINDGTAMIIQINLIKHDELTTSSPVTTSISTTSKLTSKQSQQNELTSDVPFVISTPSDCVNLSQNDDPFDPAHLNDNNEYLYTCFYINSQTLGPSVIHETDGYFGAILFDCSNIHSSFRRPQLIFLNDFFNPNKSFSRYSPSQIKRLKISRDVNNQEKPDMNQVDSKHLFVELECRYDKRKYYYSLVLRDFKSSISEDKFMVVNKKNYQQLNPKLLDIIDSNGRISNTNLDLILLSRNLISTPSSSVSATKTTMTASTATSKTTEKCETTSLDNKSLIDTELTTSKAIITISNLESLEGKSKFNSNLKLFVITVCVTIGVLLIVLYLIFLMLKRISTKSPTGSSQHLEINSSKRSLKHLNYESNRSNHFRKSKKSGIISNFCDVFTGSKNKERVSLSTSANTIETRTSIIDNASIHRNTDLFIIQSKHFIEDNEFSDACIANRANPDGSHDFATEDLKVNDLRMSKNTNKMFVYSDGYLNQMGINMMDDLKNLCNINSTNCVRDKQIASSSSTFMMSRHNNDFIAHSASSQSDGLICNDLLEGINLNYNKHRLDNNNHLTELNDNDNDNKYEYSELGYYKWGSLLDWKLDYGSLCNVLEDLVQLK